MSKLTRVITKIILNISLIIAICPIVVYAWGDSDGGRPSYTVKEIDNGAIGATPSSVGDDFKNSPNYPGQIIFNAISDGIIGDEKDYVGARECTVLENGRCNGANTETIWNANDITVEDGKTYIVRAYVHNNNPNGEDAVAENTRIHFSIPTYSSRTIQVNGFITSDNASPREYVDYVNFNSDTAFHLEYIEGSALLENEGIGKNGYSLNDDIVNDQNGVLIGYNALDGKIPGDCDNFVTIQVKVVYDNEFTVTTQARILGSTDKTWRNTLDAKIGDKVEFQIAYTNTSLDTHNNVVIRDILPANLEYINGSTMLYNSNDPKGTRIIDDTITTEAGINIGHYAPGANAYIRFTAEVTDQTLGYGYTTLVNWAQANAGNTDDTRVVLQDYNKVNTYKAYSDKTIYVVIILSTICFFVFAICIRKIYMIRHRR